MTTRAARLDVIKPTPLSPSERLLRAVLEASISSDAGGVSDVIITWCDVDGIYHMRCAANHAPPPPEGKAK